MIGTKNIWIHNGYELFAIKGENGLKVEILAKKAGVSKSSFYHHFADSEAFFELLLKHHLQQVKTLAKKEKAVEAIDPELIHILLEHKTDLLFNRQLRFNQNDKRYKETLLKSNQIIGNDFVNIWKKDRKMHLTNGQLEGIFELALENFFLQINPENLNYNWLSQYFRNLNALTQRFS